MERAWAGVDIGKRHHHAVVVDVGGEKALSRRVANDESDLLTLIGDVSSLAAEVTWAIDLHSSESALLLALLVAHVRRSCMCRG